MEKAACLDMSINIHALFSHVVCCLDTNCRHAQLAQSTCPDWFSDSLNHLSVRRPCTARHDAPWVKELAVYT